MEPSFVRPSLPVIVMPRPWNIASMFSLRVSVHLSGRPSIWAALHASTNSG